MKQVIIENSSISSVLLNKPVSIISRLRPVAFGFVLAAVLSNYQQVIAQTPNPETLPPGRLEEVPITPLPTDVLPKPTENNQLVPLPTIPDESIPNQDDSNA
ncbi:MAG: ShlB/FhaC/HecB family hemolysin secretion/activation protein, partial [Nostoc sp.]